MSFQSRNANSNPLFLHFFLSESGNCEPSRPSKFMLNVKTVKTKKYRKETMTNIAILWWNHIQKVVSSDVLYDLSYSKLKHILKTYSNND